MVLVPVGEGHRQHSPGRIQQPGRVRKHEVDPEHLLVGEHQARIDDQNLTLPLQGPHVQAHLTQSAEGHVAEAGQGLDQLQLLPRGSGRGRRGRWGRAPGLRFGRRL